MNYYSVNIDILQISDQFNFNKMYFIFKAVRIGAITLTSVNWINILFIGAIKSFFSNFHDLIQIKHFLDF